MIQAMDACNNFSQVGLYSIVVCCLICRVIVELQMNQASLILVEQSIIVNSEDLIISKLVY